MHQNVTKVEDCEWYCDRRLWEVDKHSKASKIVIFTRLPALDGNKSRFCKVLPH